MNQKKNSTAEADLILAVENSVTGRAWTARPAEHRIVQAIAQNHDLPEIVARVIAGRGIGIDDADIFLNPTLKETLPDPSHFKDMDKPARVSLMRSLTVKKLLFLAIMMWMVLRHRLFSSVSLKHWARTLPPISQTV